MLRKRFGSFLVEEGFISETALRHALFQQRRLRSLRLGEVLVEMGALSPSTFNVIFVAQMHALARNEGYRPPRFGELLVREGFVDRDTVQVGLARQHAFRKKRLGEILVDLNYLRPAQLEQAVRAQLDALAAA